MISAGSPWRSGVVSLGALFGHGILWAKQPPNSYSLGVMREDFDKVAARMSAAKTEIMDRQMKLLEERYDLADRPAQGLTMLRGKPVQEGVRAKLPEGVKSWENMATMTPEEIGQGALAQGFQQY